jgi:hypothetical protein
VILLRRRGLVALGMGLVAPARIFAATASETAPPQPGADLPVPASGSLRFRIMRNGNVIGTHGLTFTQKGRTDQPPPAATTAAAGSPPGNAKPAPTPAPAPAKPPPVLGPLTVKVVIDIAVKLGPIPLYRYNNESTEIWDGDTLTRFESKTNDNGTHTKVMARRDSGTLWVETIKEKYAAPEGAIVTTYWNPRTLSAPLIDNIDGKLLHAKIVALGPETIPAANGDRIEAVHYAASGDLNVHLWYAEDKAKPGEAPPPKHWVGLALTGSDGSHITYERL